MSKTYASLYIDALGEIDDLSRKLLAAYDGIESLLMDPIMDFHLGVWGVIESKRLSEWDAIWDKNKWILEAVGVKMERPWAKEVKRYNSRQRYHWKQVAALVESTKPKRGGMDIDRQA